MAQTGLALQSYKFAFSANSPHTAGHVCRLDGLVVVDAGEEGRVMQQAASGLKRLARVGTPQEAASPLAEWLAAGDVLLLKASRGVALERLLPQLPLL